MMKALVNDFLASKMNAWELSTLRTERYRMHLLAPYLDGNPETLWGFFEKRGTSPYTRVMMWERAGHFWEWAKEKQHASQNTDTISGNPYREWRKQNARLFKNAYTKRPATLTLDETILLIGKVEDMAARQKALQLLFSGMRWEESFTIKNGWILGKGKKRREIFCPKEFVNAPYSASYHTFYRALKAVELTPHMLRKVYLSHLINNGASVLDLCTIAGWNSLNTAQSYVQSDRNRLKTLIEKIGMGAKK